NTSDDDWTNVRMALVSGRPISFQMDLYQPLYVPRPTVEPELFASLRPPTYNAPMPSEVTNINNGGTGGAGRRTVPYQPSLGIVAPAEAPAPQPGGQSNPRLTYEQLQQRRQQQLAEMQRAKDDAGHAGKNFSAGLRLDKPRSEAASVSS